MELRFARSLYRHDAVLRAADAYAPRVAARIREDGPDLVVDIDTDDVTVADHFADHVLYETIRKRQHTEVA